MLAIGLAHDGNPFGLDDLRRRVPASADWLRVVKFNLLAVIDICAECPLDRINIGVRSVLRIEFPSTKQLMI